MSDVWHVDERLLVRRDRGDSPFVTFPMRCQEGDDCALPIGHLSDHVSIEDAWDHLTRAET